MTKDKNSEVLNEKSAFNRRKWKKCTTIVTRLQEKLVKARKCGLTGIHTEKRNLQN